MTTVDIYTPDLYVEAPPHEVFERLRREQPVYRQEMPDGTWYWAVLRHADVVRVSRQPVLYSASAGGVVLEDLDPDSLAMMRNMLLAMDPPRHIEHRRNISPSFRARVIAGLEPRIRAICTDIMDAVEPGAEIDFVHDVASKLPAQIIGELMGLPRDDWPALHRMAERNSGSQDPDINPDAGDDERGNASVEMAMYAIEHAQRRRQEPPREDLTTLLLDAEIEGRHMTDIEFGSFFVQLVTAANDTTRTMLSSGLLALIEHPEQLAAVRADLDLLPGAIEEVLRWANPLHYFRRTATEDATLGGVAIGAGDKLAMVYTSANRDDEVFVDPHRFDITRDPNPHLSFGVAEHFCLGAHLARLEGRVFFEELLGRFGTIELVGPPARQRSNLNNALKSLPVTLTP
ncbi:MAG: cytochrome P450 [Acidimicrobiia bacterium]|nr:cytochrome P450 [Acidimicrobiia bacterium]